MDGVFRWFLLLTFFFFGDGGDPEGSSSTTFLELSSSPCIEKNANYSFVNDSVCSVCVVASLATSESATAVIRLRHSNLRRCLSWSSGAALYYILSWRQ